MAGNATKSSSLTHISQATLDEENQSVKTTVLINGTPISTQNPLPVDAVLNIGSIESTSTVELELNNSPVSQVNPLPISIGNGSTLLHIAQDGSISTVSVLDQAYLSANVAVGVSQVEMKTAITRLSTRRMLSIHNNGPNPIYIGPNGVTASTGRPLFADQCIDMPIGNMAVYAVSEEPGNSVIVQEIG